MSRQTRFNRWCSEREPADALRDEGNVRGGWLPSRNSLAVSPRNYPLNCYTKMADSATSDGRPRLFPVTQWTVVLAAGGTPSPESAAEVDEELRHLLRVMARR